MYEAPKLTRILICPKCGGKQIRRSRRNGIGETLLHLLFFTSPYRCRVCYKRFFRLRLLFSSGESTVPQAK
jgi:hypothetical protein